LQVAAPILSALFGRGCSVQEGRLKNRPAGCNPAPQCGKPQTELAFQQGVFWFRIPIATYTLEKRHETVYRKI
jgi:hypothetical protein